MTKREKRLQKIRQNPKNVSFEELRQVLEDYGFVLERVNGSHHLFRADRGAQAWKLNVPLKRPHVKLLYVEDALQAIDEIAASIADTSSHQEDTDE